MYDTITVPVPGQPSLEVKLSTMIATHAASACTRRSGCG